MQDKLWIVYDIAAVTLIAALVRSGWKYGLVKTLITSVSGLLALVAALSLSVPVTDFIYEEMVETKIVSYVEDHLPEMPDIPPGAQEYLEKIPQSTIIKYIDKMMDETRLPSSFSRDEDGAGELAERLAVGDSAAQAITDIFISSSAKNIIRLVSGLVLFALFSLVIKIVAGLFSEVVGMIPIVGSANRILGALAGGVWSLVIINIAVMVFYLIIAIFGEGKLLSAEALRDTMILNMLIL